MTSSVLFSTPFELPVEPWVFATLVATLFQTARFAVQKRLTLSGLSALGATWARFLWATPVLILTLLVWLRSTNAELPALSWAFWVFVLIGSVAQILATVCVLLLFKVRAFAVGLTFKKSEALQTGLLGWLILGDPLSAGGAAALLVGFFALVTLSFPSGGKLSHAGFKTIGLGLTSGAFFAATGVAFRAAVLEIDASTEIQAALALIVSITIQTLLLALWLIVRDPDQVRATLQAWRPGIVLGILSLMGSFFWFVAFALQNAAYVYALGQVELLIALMVGLIVFGEKPAQRELLGIATLALSLIALVIFA